MKYKKNYFSICLFITIVFTFKTCSTLYEQTISKSYLVYECKYHCGGWADRLKGTFLTFLTNSQNVHFEANLSKESCLSMRWHY